MQVPNIPLDPFPSVHHDCLCDRRVGLEVTDPVPIDCFVNIQKPHIPADLITFVCIVVFISKPKADNGQSSMSRVMRTILQDCILYFLVMVGYLMMMVLIGLFTEVIMLFPARGKLCLTL